jgi:uncharacterized membrane protein
VLRAVLLSDANAPLYYLLLYAWTRHLGTSDAALRLFSVLWAVACLPILWSLARHIGGRHAPLTACTLFAFAPVAVRYSTEGRMYSLLWFLVLATAWLTVRLHRHGFQLRVLLLWILTSAAGLLTHYFFLFVWAALCAWLFWQPRRLDRRLIVLAIGLAGLAVLPWYVKLPESLQAWRITQDWLKVAPSGYNPLTAPLGLAWSFFSVGNVRADKVLIAMLTVAFATMLLRQGWRRVGGRYLLLWLWISAACLGPLALDLWRGTYTSAVSRYALAGLPAAFLLVAVGLSRSSRMVRTLVLLSIVVAWSPGLRRVYTDIARERSPFREVAHDLSELSSESDVILVHSIPSGVLAVARYMEKPTLIAAWVGQLGQRRVPEDLQALTAGYRRIFLVKAHTVGEPAPQETYLREHATLIYNARLLSSQIIGFAPHDADVFFTR